MDLILVRHGQSVANRDGIMQGQYDAALSELGQGQATILANWLRERQITWDASYCSRLSRARDTARYLTDALGLPEASLDDDLLEVHAGALQAKTRAELEQLFPAFFARDITGLGDYSEFGGEAYADVQVRVQRFIAKMTKLHRDANHTVLVVAHGGLLFQLAKALICVPNPRVCMLRFSNCSVTRIQVRERRGAFIGEILWHLPVDLLGAEPSGGAAALLY
jgi:broad specificity phosphatase PhoE